MADTRISALDEETSPLDTDEVVIQRGGAANYRVSVANLLSGGGAGGGLSVGQEIFRWNRTDTSQFESTPHLIRDIGGGTPPNNVTLNVVSEATLGLRGIGNALQIDESAMTEGVAIFAVKESELTLPARFVIYANIIRVSGNEPYAIVAPCYTPDDGGGQAQGFYLYRQGNGQAFFVAQEIVDTEGQGIVSLQGGGSWTSTSYTQGGIHQTIEVFRATGETPSKSRILARESVPQVGSERGDALSAALMPNGLQAEWDGADFNRVGIGSRRTGSIGYGYVTFGDFRIFAHPWDV